MYEIKKRLKNVIKKCIPMTIKKELVLRKEINTYRKSLRVIEKNQVKLDNPKIAFILQFPETWNSMKTVYESAEKKGLNPLIICVPKPKSTSTLIYEVSSDGVNEAYETLKKQNVNVINTKLEEGKWFNLREYNPDYVFYTRPYNAQYPDEYKSNMVCQYAKICYIPYGVTLNGGMIFNSVFKANFLLQTYVTFAQSKNLLKKIKNAYLCQSLFKHNKFEYLGFPRFDLLYQDSFNNKTLDKQNFIIAWMPRWEFNTSIKGQKCSHFLEYYDEFIRFVKTHQKLNFIFRPHPLMFETLIEEKLKTQEEVEAIKKEMANIDNLSMDIDKDYLPTLQKADILIADNTSLLMEFFATGKPIILSDNAKGYLKDAKIMISSLYQVNTWKDVESILRQLIDGNDMLYDKRQKAIEKIIPKKSTAGEAIINYIMKDYKDRRKNG